MSTPGLATLPPLSLYIHIPWCVRKCPYCDFNSHALGENADELGATEAEYVRALVADLDSTLPSVWGRSVQTIFFGGGTPSLFSPSSIERLLAETRARLRVAPDAEITLEANPGTFEAAKFRDYRAAGVNRLSIGIQSFNDRHLKTLGRIHDAADAGKAIEIAQTNFDNFNLDLMYALPGQTLAEARADLAAAIATGAPHVSAYHLTIEPNTWFAKFPPPLPDDDTAAIIQENVEAMLGEAGYTHYEISAYARSGRACRHNLNYWRFGDYLGLGAGAHGKISFPDRIVREVRARNPQEYLRRIAEGTQVVERREVENADRVFEFMMNALRLAEGFDVALFTERTGLPIDVAATALNEAKSKGLIERNGERIRPTERGRGFLNDLLELFLPDAAPAPRR